MLGPRDLDQMISLPNKIFPLEDERMEPESDDGWVIVNPYFMSYDFFNEMLILADDLDHSSYLPILFSSFLGWTIPFTLS